MNSGSVTMKIDTQQLRASRSKCISLNYAIELVQLCSQMYQQSPKIVLLLGVLNIDRFATWILFGFFAVFKSSDSWSFRSLPIECVAKKSAIWVLFISFPCDFWFFLAGDPHSISPNGSTCCSILYWLPSNTMERLRLRFGLFISVCLVFDSIEMWLGISFQSQESQLNSQLIGQSDLMNFLN